MDIEQVEMTKLLGVTLDCKLSWSKNIDTTEAKIGRNLSIIKRYSAFLTTLSTKQVLASPSVVWTGAAKRDLGKLQLAQNWAARHALKSTRRTNVNDIHVNLSWLEVEERLTC